MARATWCVCPQDIGRRLPYVLAINSTRVNRAIEGRSEFTCFFIPHDLDYTTLRGVRDDKQPEDQSEPSPA